MPPKFNPKGFGRRFVKKYNKSKSKRQQYKQQKLSVATVKKIAKSVCAKTSETKISTGTYNKVEIPHNAWDTNPAIFTPLHATTMPTQGAGANQRIGNSIYVKGISMRFMFYTKAEYPNTKFRVLIFKLKRGTSATYSSVMDNQTGNVMLDKIDRNKAIKVYDRIYNNKRWIGGTNSDEQTTFADLYVPVKQKFTFLGDTSTDFSEPMYTYFMVICAYDTYGTVLGTTVGACQLWLRYTYKDI